MYLQSHKNIIISEAIKVSVLRGIYQGNFNENNLPEQLYKDTYTILVKAITEGYDKHFRGDSAIQTAFEKADDTLINEFKDNIYIFSAAKTEAEVQALSAALYFPGDEGRIRNWSEFQEEAGKIFDQFNDVYLKAEYFTALNSAKMASHWINNIIPEKKILPFLKVIGVDDPQTCDICEVAHGVVAPIDSGLWTYFCPPFHFNNCRCTLLQIDEEEGELLQTSESELSSMFDKAVSHGLTDEFMNNPALSKVIFKTSGKGQHPYFQISPRRKDAALNNFGLSIPNNNGL